MHANGARAIARGVLTAVLCAPLAIAAGARAEEGGTPSPPSSLAVFDELYARLTAVPEDGGAPSGAAAAEEIRFGLKTDLIRSDAEIEVLKLEAARFSGERQLQALDALVRAATARERRLWAAIRQLERLAGEPALAVEGAAPTAETMPPADAAAAGDKAGAKRGFGIDFAPADVIEDPDP